MKERIILLLSLLSDVSWAASFIAFLKENETQLLSDIAGNYTAGDLIAELEIRSQSAIDLGIESIGITELQTNLLYMDHMDVVQNYIFKGKGKTGIVYLDGKSEKVVGVLLISTG